MNKKTKILLTIIILVIIIIIGLVVYLFTLKPSSNTPTGLNTFDNTANTMATNTSSNGMLNITNTTNTTVSTTTENVFNEENEKKTLATDMSKYYKTLGWISLITGFNDYNETGVLTVTKNTNLLESTTSKQLFTLETIIQSSTNYSNFLILNVPDYTSTTDATPMDESTYAYYEYEAFNKAYKKLFGINFDVTERTISPAKRSFEDTHQYIYFDNRHPGANGISVASMAVSSISFDHSSNIYTANLKMNYSDRAATLTKKFSDNAILTYTRDSDNNLVFKSFTVTE